MILQERHDNYTVNIYVFLENLKVQNANNLQKGKRYSECSGFCNI